MLIRYFLRPKNTQCPNAGVLKSGCKRIQNVLKTKTFTKIVILKACILNEIYQQSQSSKSKTISNMDMGRLDDRYRSYSVFETGVSTYLRRPKNSTRHCQKSFEIVLFWPQQTCSRHCKPSMNSEAT